MFRVSESLQMNAGRPAVFKEISKLFANPTWITTFEKPGRITTTIGQGQDQMIQEVNLVEQGTATLVEYAQSWPHVSKFNLGAMAMMPKAKSSIRETLGEVKRNVEIGR